METNSHWIYVIVFVFWVTDSGLLLGVSCAFFGDWIFGEKNIRSFRQSICLDWEISVESGYYSIKGKKRNKRLKLKLMSVCSTAAVMLL